MRADPTPPAPLQFNVSELLVPKSELEAATYHPKLLDFTNSINEDASHAMGIQRELFGHLRKEEEDEESFDEDEDSTGFMDSEF